MSHSDTYLMALLLALPCAASGGEADVISARAIRAANGSFNFDVTIRSQDHGWDHYADRFEVLAPRTASRRAFALCNGNARYWYRKAGRVFPGPDAVQAELAAARRAVQWDDGWS